MKKVILMALLLVPMSIFAQKFGHFDSSAIIQLMPEYTTAQTEIQQLQAQYENDLKRMQDELKKKSEEYEKEKAKRNCKICITVSNRAIRTIKSPCRKLHSRRCRLFPTRCSALSSR